MLLIFTVLIGLIVSVPFLIWSSYPFYYVIPVCVLAAIVLFVISAPIIDYIERGHRRKHDPCYEDEDAGFVSDQPLTSSPRTPCPECNGRHVAEIIYGLPSMTDKIKKLIENKKIVLGGCMIQNNAPKWHCFDCKKDFGTIGIVLYNGKKPEKESI